MSKRIQILFVGGDGAERLRRQLAACPEERFAVRGPVSLVEARSAARELGPDLVIVGVGVLRTPDLTTLELVRTEARSARILVAGGPVTPELLSSALAAGACGILPVDLSGDPLREALLRAYAGELILEKRELRDVVGNLFGIGPRPTQRSDLTARELEVLRATAEGLGTLEVAAQLQISAGTVRAHVKSILAKLHVHSKVEAVRLAWKEGMVALPA